MFKNYDSVIIITRTKIRDKETTRIFLRLVVVHPICYVQKFFFSILTKKQDNHIQIFYTILLCYVKKNFFWRTVNKGRGWWAGITRSVEGLVDFYYVKRRWGKGVGQRLPDQPYVIKDLYHAFEKVHMLISCCYAMLLPRQMILFCTPMANLKSVPLYK